MNDILIRGMEMPKNCKTCRFNDSDLFCSITKGDIDRDDYTCHICPLVEVPTPYGDLIDRDALIDTLSASDRDIYVKCILEEDATVVIEGNMDGNKVMK